MGLLVCGGEVGVHACLCAFQLMGWEGGGGGMEFVCVYACVRVWPIQWGGQCVCKYRGSLCLN